jgi:hypothetical protein
MLTMLFKYILNRCCLEGGKDKAALGGGSGEKISFSNLRAEFTTYNTGGSLITTPKNQDPETSSYPNNLDLTIWNPTS